MSVEIGTLETYLRKKRSEGRKLVVPYITGGFKGWTDAIRAAAANGADAIEIGIPFSDPVMDGPTIQHASEMALRNGATPISILHELRSVDVGIPLAVMCYYNTVHHAGNERFETVMLAAPTAPDARLPRIIDRCKGFVYAVGLLGVTGERDTLASSALTLAKRLKAITDMPVLIGVGVSNAQQAAEACTIADGVIQGASVMRRLIEEDADAVGDYIAEVRKAVDQC